MFDIKVATLFIYICKVLLMFMLNKRLDIKIAFSGKEIQEIQDKLHCAYDDFYHGTIDGTPIGINDSSYYQRVKAIKITLHKMKQYMNDIKPNEMITLDKEASIFSELICLITYLKEMPLPSKAFKDTKGFQNYTKALTEVYSLVKLMHTLIAEIIHAETEFLKELKHIEDYIEHHS
jgi:hypothetical protein